MPAIETLQDLFPRLAKYEKRAAVIALTKDAREEWSYAQLTERAGRLAGGLAGAGLHQGDHVALCAEPRAEWFSACLGIVASGAAAVPLDTQLGDEALAHALKDSGARFVFTTSRLLKRLRSVGSGASCEPILLDKAAEDVRSWDDLSADQPQPAVKVSPDDRAVLFYTSGTTGPPKGVPLTHRNLAFEVNTLVAADLLTRDDRVLLPLPLHHVYPFTVGMFLPLALGLPIVLPYGLTGPQIVRALREGAVTAIVGVPRLYRALMAGIESRAESEGRLASALFRGALGLSTVLARQHLRIGRFLFGRIHREMGPQFRILSTGGAAIEPELAWKLEGLGWIVGMGYGLTETSPLLTLDKPGQARIGSVGRPVAGIELRIDPKVDKDGDRREVNGAPHGESSENGREGEIVARGPGVFAGYHNLPDETKEAFTDDGWFRTGDLGYFDRDGYLFITGRVKTLIVLEGGEKIQPDELEDKFQGSPAIREIGVLERDGKVVAVIRPGRGTGAEHEPGQDEDAAVRAALEERSRSLPSYQRIAEFVLTDADLPRTRLGKIRREELRKLYDEIKAGRGAPAKKGPISEEEMTPDDRALLEEPAARQTWEWLAERFSDRRLTPDASPQLDLGIDSLEWLNLTMEIRESCGVELSQEAIGRIQTVRDLLREVAEQPEGQASGPALDPLENPDAVLREEGEHWLAPLGPVESAAARFLYALNWVLIHLAYRLSVQGRERLPDQGPFILAPHHVSYLDSFVLAAALDFKRFRDTYWAGWSGIAFGPVFRFLRRLGHVVPIDPVKAAASSLAFGAAVLRRKYNMVWYPEGGHSKTGEVEPLKPGIGMLLEHYPVPVVPAFQDGTRQALPPGRIFPRPGRVRIVFGAPLDPHDLEQRGKGGKPHERITTALHDELVRLCRNGEELPLPSQSPGSARDRPNENAEWRIVPRKE